jgi:hypothetical protein
MANQHGLSNADLLACLDAEDDFLPSHPPPASSSNGAAATTTFGGKTKTSGGAKKRRRKKDDDDDDTSDDDEEDDVSQGGNVAQPSGRNAAANRGVVPPAASDYIPAASSSSSAQEPKSAAQAKLDALRDLRCCECSALAVNVQFHELFHLDVCNTCIRAFDAKFGLLSKTNAKAEYLLTEADLAPLKFIEKKNPRKKSYGTMKLYLKAQLRAAALKRWKTDDALAGRFNHTF